MEDIPNETMDSALKRFRSAGLSGNRGEFPSGDVSASVAAAAGHGTRARRESVSEISEKTRVVLNVAGVIALVSFVFFLGKSYESMMADHRTIEKHDGQIEALQRSFATIDKQLTEMNAAQRSSAENATTAVRNTTAILYSIGNLKAALESRGIHVKEATKLDDE